MSNAAHRLGMTWDQDILSITGSRLPVPAIEIVYLEAFCRPSSHERDWAETVIPHRTLLVSREEDGSRLDLESRLEDGVLVLHQLTAAEDEIDFRLVAHNPGPRASEAHWAQPCIRVGAFAGFPDEPGTSGAYLRRSFVFLDGRPVAMPTPEWATSARYTPGQVWRQARVSAADVNPRPLNPLIPSHGLIGCFSGDGRMILATAWEPYQELFQGVFQCLHSDFRMGGLLSGESKRIRGKLYLVDNDLEALLARYRRDFPEQETTVAATRCP